MAIYSLNGKTPEIHESAYVHPQASIVGDVKIGQRVFIAPMASIRGDRGPIVIGDETNVQDGAVVHSTDTYTTIIGKRVNIGHNASVHGEQIEDDAAIGMNTVIMVGAKVAKRSLIGNGAVLHPKTATEEDGVYAGVPAKLLRKMTSDDIARKTIEKYVQSYVDNTELFKKTLNRLDE
ncbi:gamma carbonic anhydrase family protein [Candidatus Thorarchaeota archaeon]|nr:MAG: gamma carbonic anhydrase family protein [Candidatus Thorarchaeota archaeon]